MLTGRRNIVISAKPKKAPAKMKVAERPKAQAAAVVAPKVMQKRTATRIVSKVDDGDEADRQARRDAADAVWRKVSGQE